MNKFQLTLLGIIVALFGMRLGIAQDQKPAMSFFVISHGPGSGASLGGLAGADARGSRVFDFPGFRVASCRSQPAKSGFKRATGHKATVPNLVCVPGAAALKLLAVREGAG